MITINTALDSSSAMPRAPESSGNNMQDIEAQQSQQSQTPVSSAGTARQSISDSLLSATTINSDCNSLSDVESLSPTSSCSTATPVNSSNTLGWTASNATNASRTTVTASASPASESVVRVDSCLMLIPSPWVYRLSTNKWTETTHAILAVIYVLFMLLETSSSLSLRHQDWWVWLKALFATPIIGIGILHFSRLERRLMRELILHTFDYQFLMFCLLLGQIGCIWSTVASKESIGVAASNWGVYLIGCFLALSVDASPTSHPRTKSIGATIIVLNALRIFITDFLNHGTSYPAHYVCMTASVEDLSASIGFYDTNEDDYANSIENARLHVSCLASRTLIMTSYCSTFIFASKYVLLTTFSWLRGSRLPCLALKMELDWKSIPVEASWRQQQSAQQSSNEADQLPTDESDASNTSFNFFIAASPCRPAVFLTFSSSDDDSSATTSDGQSVNEFQDSPAMTSAESVHFNYPFKPVYHSSWLMWLQRPLPLGLYIFIVGTYEIATIVLAGEVWKSGAPAGLGKPYFVLHCCILFGMFLVELSRVETHLFRKLLLSFDWWWLTFNIVLHSATSYYCYADTDDLWMLGISLVNYTYFMLMLISFDAFPTYPRVLKGASLLIALGNALRIYVNNFLLGGSFPPQPFAFLYQVNAHDLAISTFSIIAIYLLCYTILIFKHPKRFAIIHKAVTSAPWDTLTTQTGVELRPIEQNRSNADTSSKV